MNPWCRPSSLEKQERPTLVLLLGCGRDEGIALAVGAGCEEEGVPVIWERADASADELARQAAQRSRLEVGIGIDAEKGAVTFAKYPSPEAYLKTEVGDLKTARWLGQAAACFVKSKPLPDREEQMPDEMAERGVPLGEALPIQGQGKNPESLPSSESLDEATSEAVVARITREVMKALRRQR